MTYEQDSRPGNRAMRRMAKHDTRDNQRTLAGFKTVKPKDTDSLLDREDDLPLYKSEFELSKKLERQYEITLMLFLIHMRIGVSEESYRRHLIAWVPGQNLYDPITVQAQLLSEIHPAKAQQQLPRIQSLLGERKRLGIKVDFSTEMIEEALLLLTDREIPIEDLLREGVRSRHETTELLRMQIAWLEDREKRAKAQDHKKTPELTLESQLEAGTNESGLSEPETDILKEDLKVIKPEEDFVLSGWNVAWTTRHWSTNPNHFIPIPTTSRVDALEVFEQIARGEIMIKPGSVMRALEMHLRKDFIQQALATRLKYGPEERRNWIKIKRGRDRILLLIPEDHQVIFFAGNRDSIYR